MMDGNAKLCKAVLDHHVPTIRRLVESGAASPNEKGPCDHYPLAIAIAIRSVDAVRTLLECGASVEVPNGDQSISKHTLLDAVFTEAELFEKVEPLNVLLDAGFDVNYFCEDGRTLLMKAAWSSVVQTKHLLDRGADPNLQSGIGWTALMYAADTDVGSLSLSDAESVVKLLVASGADISARNPQGETAADILERQAMIDDETRKQISSHLCSS
jgi:ankyrin repeat protein